MKMKEELLKILEKVDDADAKKIHNALELIIGANKVKELNMSRKDERYEEAKAKYFDAALEHMDTPFGRCEKYKIWDLCNYVDLIAAHSSRDVTEDEKNLVEKVFEECVVRDPRLELWCCDFEDGYESFVILANKFKNPHEALKSKKMYKVTQWTYKEVMK